MEVLVEFCVVANTDSGERVALVGDVSQLGSWTPEDVVLLEQKGKAEDGKDIWSKTVQLPPDQKIHYRFLKVYVRPAENGHVPNDQTTNGKSAMSVMISSWECHIVPRCIDTSGNVENPPLATFGTNGGVENVDRGWLTSQTEVRLRLHNNPIRMWKGRHRCQTYSVKCTPIDLEHGEMLTQQAVMLNLEEESNHDIPLVKDAPPVSVSVLRDSLMVPHVQPMFGTIYKEEDYIVFRAQTFHPNTQGYQFDLFLCHPSMNEMDTHKHIGTAYLLPMNLDQLTGTKSIPIVGLQQKPIGHLVVEYLIINPMPEQSCDLSVSYARYWKSKRPVDVGHRGLGATYCYDKKGKAGGSPKRCETIKENTIASLSEAFGHGADYVEFDVQLSKDKVPVIYHDLVVGLSLKKKENLKGEHFEVPIRDLKVEQLHKLKVKHLAAPAATSPSDESIEASLENGDNIDTRPFPTLKECLERVDQGIGFNIEVKYCMPLKDGGNEQGIEHFAERNEYIDVILKDVLTYANGRRIIFSCFDPDVCTILRLKQNRYPVLFLCSDICEAWPVYQDSRTWEVTTCAAFCASEQLLGVNVATDNFLSRPELVEKIKKLGLVSFCWGWNEETNSKHTVARVKQLGVDGVIYDKIHEIKVLSPDDDFIVDQAEVAKSITESVTDAEIVSDAASKRQAAQTANDPSLSFAGRIQSFATQDS